MEEKKLTPLKAIRAKCLDCCCQQANEVRLCTVKGCPLYDYRMGKNPNRKGVGSETSETQYAWRNPQLSRVIIPQN